MPSGALLLPMTKVGAGDKERAYVVRQNIFLKTIVAVMAALVLLGTTLCCTIYKVDLQRRTSLKDAREHREEEHNSHMRIMRLGMLLQQRLKDEVHDMKVLTTYRSWLLRSVGDYQGQVLQKLGANCTLADEQLRSLGLQFDQRIDALMKRLWDDLVQEGRAAQTQLHNITTAIMHELRQDASEASDFEALMRANGEDARDDVEGDGDYDEHEEDHDLGVALAEFHERLQRNDSVLALDAPTLERWQQQYDATMRVLSTQEEEADMVRINKNLDALVAASHAPPCAAASTPRRGTRRADPARPRAQPPARPARRYNASTHASELDYFTDLLYRAKLAPHREQLLKLLGAWHAGEAPLHVPLKRVEELIDQNVLQPDTLLISGDTDWHDESYYKYDDEHEGGGEPPEE